MNVFPLFITSVIWQRKKCKSCISVQLSVCCPIFPIYQSGFVLIYKMFFKSLCAIHTWWVTLSLPLLFPFLNTGTMSSLIYARIGRLNFKKLLLLLMCQLFQYPRKIPYFSCSCFPPSSQSLKMYVEGWNCFHNKNEAGRSWSEQPVDRGVWLIISQPGYSPQLLKKSLLFWGICPSKLTCFSFSDVFLCGGGKLQS